MTNSDWKYITIVCAHDCTFFYMLYHFYKSWLLIWIKWNISSCIFEQDWTYWHQCMPIIMTAHIFVDGETCRLNLPCMLMILHKMQALLFGGKWIKLEQQWYGLSVKPWQRINLDSDGTFIITRTAVVSVPDPLTCYTHTHTHKKEKVFFNFGLWRFTVKPFHLL